MRMMMMIETEMKEGEKMWEDVILVSYFFSNLCYGMKYIYTTYHITFHSLETLFRPIMFLLPTIPSQIMIQFYFRS